MPFSVRYVDVFSTFLRDKQSVSDTDVACMSSMNKVQELYTGWHQYQANMTASHMSDDFSLLSAELAIAEYVSEDGKCTRHRFESFCLSDKN